MHILLNLSVPASIQSRRLAILRQLTENHDANVNVTTSNSIATEDRRKKTVEYSLSPNLLQMHGVT